MTMTGIIIAVLAAIMVVSIGQGIERQVTGQIGRLGKDLITIRPGDKQTGSLLTNLGAASVQTQLSRRDVAAAQAVSHVRSVTPLALVDGAVTAERGGQFNGSVIGTTPDFARTVHQGLDFGTFFSADEGGAQMAVIGSDVAANLFQENVPLGRGFSIGQDNFIVVGILQPFEAAPLIGQTDFNDAIFIPYKTGLQMTQNSAPVYQILVRPDSPANVGIVSNGLDRALLRVHAGQHNFAVLKQSQSLAVTNGILDLMSKLVLAAAITALLVGGVGIMNIMWVSVVERMREIGIRKAVGATSRQILAQFLVEAIMLSLGGWLIGVSLSLIAILILHFFTTLGPTIPYVMIGLSFVVTLVTGVVFGSVPAIKAALKDPINALRNE